MTPASQTLQQSSASSSAPKTLQTYVAPVVDYLADVKTSLLSIIPPQSQLLAETVGDSLNSGGKYLRPAITLLAGLASAPVKSAENIAALVEVAAVSEMIHIATLLHDDVLDEATLRRGKTTVRATLGNKISVLSGDYLLAQASLKLSKLGNTRLVSIYAQVLADLCDGEVEQMKNSYASDQPLDLAWQSYRHKTFCKTASLFAAGCEAAGVVNQLPEPEIQALRSYGEQFGMAFQVVDDLLDYTSTEAEMGKPVLDDLQNGLLNAPVLLALESPVLSLDARTRFQAVLNAVFEAPTVGQLSEVMAILEETAAFDRTRDLIADYVAKATQALAFLPDSLEKLSLLGLVAAISERRS